MKTFDLESDGNGAVAPWANPESNKAGTERNPEDPWLHARTPTPEPGAFDVHSQDEVYEEGSPPQAQDFLYPLIPSQETVPARKPLLESPDLIEPNFVIDENRNREATPPESQDLFEKTKAENGKPKPTATVVPTVSLPTNFGASTSRHGMKLIIPRFDPSVAGARSDPHHLMHETLPTLANTTPKGGKKPGKRNPPRGCKGWLAKKGNFYAENSSDDDDFPVAKKPRVFTIDDSDDE